MRRVLPLLLLTTPAHAWEFTPGIPCRLTHDTPEASIALTYDPTQPLYSVTVTRTEPWPDAPVFSMRFDGPRSIGIGTDKHVLSDEGRALTVSDSGFGNVLNGLQYNDTAHALAGGVDVAFPLEGAAEPVAAFRACDAEPLAS